MIYFAQGVHLAAAVSLLIILLITLVLAFEIWMLVDVIKNPGLSPEERAIWIVGMLLVHPFVAIAYYFLRRTNLSN